MRTLIILAATASVLTLGACNRESDTETAPASDTTITGAGAVTAGSEGMDASAMASNGSAAPGSPRTAGDMTAGADGETMDPAGSTTAGFTGTAIEPATEATRDTAKEAAEATNLHPRPVGQ